MAEDFPLMPVVSGGPAGPLEGNTASAPGPGGQGDSTFGSAFKSAYYGSPAVTLLNRGIGQMEDNTPVSYEDAVHSIKEQNLDPAFIPKSGMSRGALRREAERQAAEKLAELRMQRAGGGSIAGNITAGIAAGFVDPSNLVLGPAAAKVMNLARVGLAGRAAIGAGVGAAYAGGMEGAQAHLTGHDEDLGSWSMLRDMTFGAAFGGIAHAAFGPRPAGVSQAAKGAIADVLAAEGGTTTDTGGFTRFGISAKAHPNVDIANLTPEAAADIYHKQYWQKINGDALPANLQRTAMDAAVNQGVGNARRWIRQSGGDVAKFNELRRQQYEQLAKDNPAKYGQYLKGWLNRLDKIEGAPEGRAEFGTKTYAPYDYTELRNPQEAIDDAHVALSQFANDEVVDPVAVRASAFRAPTHEDEVADIFSQAYKAATPWEQRLAEYRQTQDRPGLLHPEEREQLARLDAHKEAPVAQPSEATPPEAEAHRQYVADAKAQFAGLDEFAQERLDNEITAAHTSHEEGTQMTHDEMTKTVQAAIRCGVMKGISYGD